jgi:ABC-2 type transport system ATP-binding protein
MIEIEQLTKQFGALQALDGVTMRLGSGRIVGLLGENGCGKTTLLQILAGVSQPTSGRVAIDQHAPGPYTKGIVSYLPDNPNLPGGSKVRNLIEYMEDFFSDFERDVCQELLRDFGVDGNRKMSQLSKGQREKVQVSLCMARRAKVYLLDEPISGVDPAARDFTLRAILSAMQSDSLMLIATHLVSDIEGLLDEAVLMRHGKILTAGSVDDLRHRTNQSLNEHMKEVYA